MLFWLYVPVLKNDSCQASEVILMGVSQRDHVELLVASRPQIRRHSFLSRIDPGMLLVPRESAECSPSVDEQSSSTGRDDKKRIPLTYVQDRHFQLSRRPLRPEGEEGDEH